MWDEEGSGSGSVLFLALIGSLLVELELVVPARFSGGASALSLVLMVRRGSSEKNSVLCLSEAGSIA